MELVYEIFFAAISWLLSEAETAEECLDKEGPNSRTVIDLTNKIDGKMVPLFDQYEHHCVPQLVALSVVH